ncbi:MAG TPA: YdeI/OmpD-associated family protein [Usitatibacter sp.]|nr:YdeI/OmpD-associated family protein [Usitatibacter sp.]
MSQRLEPPENSCHPKSRAQWRRWLERNHARAEGVWLVTYKKASGKARMSYDEAVEEALCWGWIDSRTRALDDERGMLWMAPRKAKSGWSRTNKVRVKRLTAEGLMAPPGLARIAAAKRDGSWSALDDVEDMVVPADLSRALASSGAQAHFDGFAPSIRKAILGWIASAKRPETRGKRVEETARLAAMKIPPPQWIRK